MVISNAGSVSSPIGMERNINLTCVSANFAPFDDKANGLLRSVEQAAQRKIDEAYFGRFPNLPRLTCTYINSKPQSGPLEFEFQGEGD